MMFKFKREKSFCIEKFLNKAKRLDMYEDKPYIEPVQYFEKTAPKVTQKKYGLKIVVISDTHGDLAPKGRFKSFMDCVKAYDLVIILGDLYPQELDRIVELVPKKKIIALRGNHDQFSLYERHGILNVNEQVVTIGGVNFAGIEGSLRYKNESFPSYTHFESLRAVYYMPKNADVLLTHDSCFREFINDRAHAGMAGITYYLYTSGVTLHIHGHVHKSYRKEYPNGAIEKCVYGCEYMEI